MREEIDRWTADIAFSLNVRKSNYQHHIVSTLSTDLVGEVDLDVSFIWERTKNPQERIDTTIPEKDDFRLMLSVGYDF